ncbi:MAG TPA: hypothetical protein VHV83_05340, partial [Armatimonadota bacterium]|nr:hypothetical protein [Armatimonadota bacterium]
DSSTPSADTQKAVAEKTVTQNQITYGDFSIKADTLNIFGDKNDLEKLTAQGNVEIRWPLPANNGMPIFLTFNAKNMLINSQQKTDKASGKISTFHTLNIQNAELTTCDGPQGHRHYGIHVKSFTIYPDQRYEARDISPSIAGLHLLGLPRYRGSLTGEPKGPSLPTINFGNSGIDGMYIGTRYTVPIDRNLDFAVGARFGTNELLRGNISVNRPVSLNEKFGHGTLSLLATWHEDVQNRLVSTDKLADSRLNNLTISRLPALQLSVDPVKLLGGKDKQFTLRVGSGLGRYHEDPTSVTKTRFQAWGIIDSPRYRLGPVNVSGEIGMREAFYGDSTHQAFVTQLSLETLETSRIYANVSFLRRREEGTTPFLFDRVIIPDELYTEVITPIGKKSPWSVGFANREDLSEGKSRSLSLSAIYSLDCISYGVTYDVMDKGFTFGAILNGFGSFRKGTGRIAFTQ